MVCEFVFFFFSSRRRHTRFDCDWSSDVCSSDLRESADWDRFVTAIEGMTDEELFDPQKFGWTEGDPFVEWVTGNANEHIDEHLEQLTRPAMLPRRSKREARVGV